MRHPSELDTPLSLEPERYELQAPLDGPIDFDVDRREVLGVLGGGLLCSAWPARPMPSNRPEESPAPALAAEGPAGPPPAT
jgi:hypothetical protein